MAAAALFELRALGVATSDGPVALTDLGRAALKDPASVDGLEFGSSSAVIVQADHTVIGPPDLDPSVAAELVAICEVESEAGAFIYRLDPQRITRAVQGGRSVEEILAFLHAVSSVPVPEPVTWMVRDAAARANRVKVVSAATVVVVTDPADLTTACAIKSIRLVRIADNVAITHVAHAKVQSALDAKGLSPELLLGDVTAKARSTTGPAKGRGPVGGGGSGTAGSAPLPRGVDKRLQVTGRLAMTPDLVAALDDV
jgi:hypothetical protein